MLIYQKLKVTFDTCDSSVVVMHKSFALVWWIPNLRKVGTKHFVILMLAYQIINDEINIMLFISCLD